jgi:hypothetical protein
MTDQSGAPASGSAREDNVTSKTALHEVVEQPRAPVLVMNDREVSQPDGVDLEAGNRPEMQKKTVSTEPASKEVYTIFTRGEIIFIAIMASISTFFSPLTANIYFPALNTISTDLGVSDTLVNLTVTTYMVTTPSRSRSHMLNIDRFSKALHQQSLEGSPTHSAEDHCTFSALCFISMQTSRWAHRIHMQVFWHSDVFNLAALVAQ